ncbi:hypothetical protein D910_03526 [Dendroctonus ponderosae]
MACLWRNQNRSSIEIPSTEEFSSVTYYVIHVTVGEVKWKVKHRYNDFFNLHSKLVVDHGVSKDILPSKKLYAISELVKSCFPDADNLEKPLDLGPILDMCSQLDSLVINGSNSEYLQSNIVLNKLPFEMSQLKIDSSVCFKKISLSMISSLGSLRSTLTVLKVSYTDATSICDILQCDVLHKTAIEGSQKWDALETLDLSHNNLVDIDKTIHLAVSLKHLILNHNKISTISNLMHLPRLEELSIVNNLITICDQLHTKVGNIKSLNLSQNNVVTTKGFKKLYSLENLDLSCNKITEIEDLRYLGNLPCLENITLTGNNVSTTIDYRVKVLELFGNRAKDICLDNEKPSQSELDKVSVLSALRIVKEGKTPDLSKEMCK